MANIPRKMRFLVLNEAGFRCQYCGRGAPDVALEVDHIVPKARGGLDRRSNYVAACFDCNRGKRDKALLVPADDVIDLSTSPLQFYGDCCPWCPVELVVFQPVSAKRDGEGVTTRHRCERGHDWGTWTEMGTALWAARANYYSTGRYWPPLSQKQHDDARRLFPPE